MGGFEKRALETGKKWSMGVQAFRRKAASGPQTISFKEQTYGPKQEKHSQKCSTPVWGKSAISN